MHSRTSHHVRSEKVIPHNEMDYRYDKAAAAHDQGPVKAHELDAIDPHDQQGQASAKMADVQKRDSNE
jgi:hypothetical protein